MFVDALAPAGDKVRVAVLLYSYYSEWVTHFTKDFATTKNQIEGMTWPQSLTYTANALNTARSEFSLGREGAASIVVLITDGRPMSLRKTRLAAQKLRQQARLITVPVTKWAPVGQMKKWASNPKEDNFLRLDTFSALEDPKKMSLLIAKMNP